MLDQIRDNAPRSRVRKLVCRPCFMQLQFGRRRSTMHVTAASGTFANSAALRRAVPGFLYWRIYLLESCPSEFYPTPYYRVVRPRKMPNLSTAGATARQ